MRLRVRALFVLAVALCWWSFPGLALSQTGTTQVTIAGVPPVLPSPVLQDVVDDYDSGRFLFNIVYSSPSTNPTAFQLRVELTRDGQTVGEVVSDPVDIAPGVFSFTRLSESPGITFRESVSDLIDIIDAGTVGSVESSGTLPEGLYVLTATLEPVNTSAAILAVPGRVVFRVRFVPPPVLFTPSDRATVNIPYPVFSWTPVSVENPAAVEYDFLLVEVRDGQTPLDAIEGNRAHLQTTLTGQTTLQYDPRRLPLEAGTLYAWQVRARDPVDGVPITEDGYSEIYEFSFGGRARAEQLDNLDNIVIEPGFAVLTNLGEVRARRTRFSYILEGPAELQLRAPGAEAIPVTLDGLEIQNVNLERPVLMAGSVQGRRGLDFLQQSGLPDIVQVDALNWAFGEGFSIDGRIALPDGRVVDAEGLVRYTQSGLFGEMAATGDPIFSVADELIRVDVDRVAVRLPGGQITGSGEVSVLGAPGCRVDNVTFEDGAVRVPVACASGLEIPLAGERNEFNLNIERVDGAVTFDEAGAAYELAARLEIQLDTQNVLERRSERCGLSAVARITSADGLSVDRWSRSCINPKPELNLGFFRAALTDLNVDEFSFDGSEWAVALLADVELSSPYLDEYTLPVIPGVQINQEGIDFPETRFGQSDLRDVVPMEALTFIWRNLTFPAFRFAWFQWDRVGTGPWNFQFAGGLRFPDDVSQPACLRGSEIEVVGAYADPEGMFGGAQLQDVTECRIELGRSGTAVVFENLEVTVATWVDFNPNAFQKYKPFAEVVGDGRIEYGEPFACEAGSDDVGRFSFSPGSGGINLELSDFVPSCGMKVGPLTATVTQSDVSLVAFQRRQMGTMSGAARIALDQSNFADGTFELDLVTGTFTNLDFALESGFSFAVPAEDPVFEFEVDRARLDANGLLVDGTQTLRLGAAAVEVDFDNALLNLDEGAVASGSISLENSFAFVGGIDRQSSALRFRAAASGSEPPFDPGFAADIDGAAVLDSSGFRFAGYVDARVLMDSQPFDSDVRATFSDDFAFDVSEPAIGRGRVDFYYQDTRVAYADPTGFYPAVGDIVTELLPDVLPLPSPDIAYLRLKDGDTDLVSFSDQGGGELLVTSAGSGPVLVVPAIDPATPPELANVELQDLVVRTSGNGFEYVSGSVRVNASIDVPDAWPINVRSLAFESRSEAGATLYLDGSLVLFGRDLGAEADVSLAVGPTGVSGSVQLDNLGATVPLVGESDVVRLALNGVAGYVEAGVTNRSRLDLDARVEVVAGDGQVAGGADLGLRWDGASLVVTSFDAGAAGNGRVEVGPVAFEVNAVAGVGGLSYAAQTGWLFDVALDMRLIVQLAEGREFVIPLQNIAATQNGLVIGPQAIHGGTIPGLDLPAFQLAGVWLKPIGAYTDTPTTIDWYTGDLAAVDMSGFVPRFDFELRAPMLAAHGVMPPDGLLIRDATVVDGLVEASVESYQPAGAVDVPVLGTSDGPVVAVSEVSGALNASPQQTQLVSIELLATLQRLGLIDEDPGCVASAPFRMQVIDGLYFQGSVENYAPCGNVELGPATLSFGPSTVAFAFAPDTESVLLNGSANLAFPGQSDGSTVSVTGNVEVDVLEGRLTDGQVVLDQPFRFGVPLEAEEPLLVFDASNAILDVNGFTISGSGALQADGTSASVQFADLQFGFPDLAVAGGTATISSSLDLQLDLSPLGFGFVQGGSPAPADNYIRVGLSGDIVLSTVGLGFSGAATADLVFAGNALASLTTEFGDGFALNAGSFAVNQGFAHFFTAQEPDEPIAILDENGFSIGGGIVALLPARIGLPTDEVAYLVTRDPQGNPLIDATASGNGWDLSTNAPVSLVLAGLADDQQPAPTVDVSFQLNTDAAYNVLAGSLTLATPVDLEPSLGLPVIIDALTLETNSPLQLVAQLSVNLPEALGDHDLTATVGLTESGFADARLELGDPSQTYREGLAPVSSHTFSAAVGNANHTMTFAIQGVGITVGASPRVDLAATVSSSLLGEPDEPAFFFAGGFGNDAWSLAVDPVGLEGEIPLGVASLRPLGGDPFEIVLDETSFELSIDGELSFEELFGEPMDVLVQNFTVGVEDVPANPTLTFGLDAVTLPDQEFSLFEGAVELAIDAPKIEAVNGVIGVQSDGGSLDFADIAFTYGALEFDTGGDFSISDLTAGGGEILGGFASLESVDLTATNGALQFAAAFDITLPEPVDASTSATITIRRDANGQVVVDADMGALDLDVEYALGDFGSFKLTKATVDFDPYDPLGSGIYLNGVVNVGDDAVVWFGNDASFPNEAGISYSELYGLRYNVSGNVQFDLETSFFTIAVSGDAATSNLQRFELELGGAASVNIEGVGGSVGYEGFTVGSDGVSDVGRLVAPAEFTLLDIMTLSVGSFDYISNPNGEQVQIADGFGQGISDVQARAGQSAPTQSVTVTEYLCFGRCGTQGSNVSLSIGGSGNNDGGAFSGGVDEVLFYKTPDGSTYLHIDNFNAQLSDVFEISASLQYANTSDGLILRAVGGGVFDVGNTQAQAALAGSFSNINGELSFGLFVAVSSSVGVPIVPGVVELTGLGGGFFYNPKQADLDLVTGPSGALAAFGYTPIKPVPSAGDVDFAAMLFAQAGIGGSAGNYVVEGGAFLQLTNRSIVIDATGSVLGFDGEGFANAELTAGFSIAASRAPFMLDGNVAVDVNIPIYASGGVDVNVFMLERDGRLVWGIIGNGELGLINNMFTATGTFAAADIGFLLEAGISFNFNIPIISINVSAEGAIWLMTDEQFPMPFGAYAIVAADVCVDVGFDEACAGADLRAAIVKKRPSGFEMFGAIAVQIPIAGKVRAWAAVSESGVRAGFGKGASSDLIAQAQQQAQDFKDYVTSLADDIESARQEMENQTTPLEDLIVSAEDAAAAGARFHTLERSERTGWAQQIVSNEPVSVGSRPGYRFVRDSLFYGDSPGPRPEQNDPAWDGIYEARDKANAFEDEAVSVAALVEPRLRQAELQAIELSADVTQILDDFYASIAESPLTQFDPGQSGPNAVAPSFTIDAGTAAAIAGQSNGLSDAVEALADETVDAIDTISDNLGSIHRLMALQLSVDLNYDPFTGEIRGATFESEPSVNDMMRFFITAETAFDEYYARYAGWYWSGRAWALRMQDKLITQRSTIESDITAAYDAQSSKAARISTSAERVRILAELSGSEDAQAAYQAHQDLLENVDDNTLRQSYITNGLGLWYDFNVGGLGTLADRLGSSAVSILTEQSNRVRPLLQAHARVTDTMERVYQLRADITAMQYVLVDNLLSQHAENPFLADSTETRMMDLKDRLSKSLQVPTIGNITVQTVREGYAGRATIGVSMQHPLSIAEVSVQVERNGGDGTGEGLGDYRSVGAATQIPFYTSKSGYSRDESNEAFHERKDFSVGVRARGPAGNTAIRRQNFGVDVGPMAGSSSVPPPPDPDPDTTPPETPRLMLSEVYESTPHETIRIDPATGDITQFTELRYWTLDGTKIEVFVYARDEESDISTFEYAVGTSNGGTNIIDWTSLQGQRFRADGFDGKPAVFVRGSTRLFTLQPGSRYYLSVRATNGVGMSSTVQGNGPVIHDPTPPTAPRPVFTVPIFVLPFPGQVPTYPAVTTVPSYSHPGQSRDGYITSSIQNVRPPEVTPMWRASDDPESGIEAYEYVTNPDPAAPQFSPQRTVVDTFRVFKALGTGSSDNRFVAEFSGLPRSYVEPLVVGVRARNNAGAASDPLMVQRQAKDPTGPFGLNMRARVRADAVDIFLTNAVYDFESDVAGLEYSIGSQPGETDLRGWPAQVDFAWSNAYSAFQSSNAAPSFAVAAATLPQGQEFYINVRARNSQGGRGGIVAAGPLFVDTSPPLTPSIALSKSGSYLKIDVSGMQDPESGLAKIEYRVEDRFDPFSSTPWRTFRYVSGNPTNALSYARTVSVSGVTSLNNARVHIRLTNAVGGQTITSKSMPLQIPPPPLF